MTEADAPPDRDPGAASPAMLAATAAARATPGGFGLSGRKGGVVQRQHSGAPTVHDGGGAGGAGAFDGLGGAGGVGSAASLLAQPFAGAPASARRRANFGLSPGPFS